MSNQEWPQLNNVDAHQEANLMKAELGVDPELFGLIRKDGELREPTAEDYDYALEVVEEIKKIAEEEPATEIVLNTISRLAVKSAYGVAEVFAALATGPGGNSAEHIYQNKQEILSKLEDASVKLRNLKSKAVEMGAKENQVESNH